MPQQPNRTTPAPCSACGAHPDDEAYMSAGVMATAIRAGQRVTVATATRGELGTDDPVRTPPQQLARLREHELAASLAALGVAEHRWLGPGGETRSRRDAAHRRR